jgi:hypothetical protein
VPLDSYGVLVGTLHRSFRDRPDDQGRWFHVNLEVDAPAGRYRCAVDVDSKKSTVGVQWKVLRLAGPQLAPLTDLAPGGHDLPRAAGSHLQAAQALEPMLVPGRRVHPAP